MTPNFSTRITTSAIARLALTISAFTFSACGPRGESHTVDQIFSDAKVAYSRMSASVIAGGLPADVTQSISKISQDVDLLAGVGGVGDAKSVAKEVSGLLDSLISKSGMTQRASMTELVNQYRIIAKSEGPVSIQAPQLKLIAARTYALLNAELTSTKFGL